MGTFAGRSAMPDDDSMLGQNVVDVRDEARRNAQHGEQLFAVPPKLTERQAFVYELAKQRPLSPRDAGVQLHVKHQRRCGCGPERCCDWAERNGREVLEAIKRKGLLRRDRHHVYRRADDSTTEPAGGHDPSTAQIPF